MIVDAAAKRVGTHYGLGMAIAEEPPKKKRAMIATKRAARACSKCSEFEFGHCCDSTHKCKKHPQYQSGKGESFLIVWNNSAH